MMTDPLPRSTPEKHGISSTAIRNWIAAAAVGNELHSVMILRHGEVLAEGWWAPYRSEAVHRLYSLSKSFTSTAVGLAIDEGLVGLDDLVIEFFPDCLPEAVDDQLAALRVRHLLTMSAGHATDSTSAVTHQVDWVRTFFAQPFTHAPGSEFLYDTAATYVLSAIVQQAAGMTVLEYLRPRLFDPLGIDHVEWQSCPRGVDVGGWGMSTTTEALAKFGLLYLQKGLWSGRRVLREEWVEQATSLQIATPADFISAEWQQGYGYQFWQCRHGAYRADGAFGQNCIVMPDQDAVIVVTSSSSDVQRQLDAVWDILLPAMGTSPLPADPDAVLALTAELGGAGVALPIGSPTSSVAAQVAGQSFTIEPNELAIDEVSLDFGEGVCRVMLGDQRIDCGIGRWIDGRITLAHTPPEMESMVGVAEVAEVVLAAAGAWTDESTFEMVWQYFTTPHHDRVSCRFHAGGVEIEFLNSITASLQAAHPTLPPQHPEARPVLSGRRQAETTRVLR
jgi:CubicO group peptidase (beta-lactamase class C family)